MANKESRRAVVGRRLTVVESRPAHAVSATSAARRTPAALTHLDARGRARMVDVSEKAITRRMAVAEADVRLSPKTLVALRRGTLAKGDAFAVVRIAAIQGAKRTAEIVPLCHPLALDHVAADVVLVRGGVHIRVTAVTTGRTGVEMEAMTGAAAGALALYDMIKGLEHGAIIRSIRLRRKEGGRSGKYIG